MSVILPIQQTLRAKGPLHGQSAALGHCNLEQQQHDAQEPTAAPEKHLGLRLGRLRCVYPANADRIGAPRMSNWMGPGVIRQIPIKAQDRMGYACIRRSNSTYARSISPSCDQAGLRCPVRPI